MDNQHHNCIVPQDEDIEKSFRVNQDGSMTVEMKVRLTIKEEEMLHWTTTLSRSSISKRTGCASISESGNSSPDSNNVIANDSSNMNEEEAKEENNRLTTGKVFAFKNEGIYEDYTSEALGKAKPNFKRAPTPGPRHVKKRTSVESVKTVTESGVQENTLGHYTYIEKRVDGETTEGYCVVRHSSSSSNRPIPKPRKTVSAGSSVRSSGVAEVLQIQSRGVEVTETVMHIYESRAGFDNYLANEEYSADGVPLHGSSPALPSKPSTDSGSAPSSNDIDFSWQQPSADSLQRQKEEMLSLSSESVSPTQHTTNKLSSVPENKSQTARNIHFQPDDTVSKDDRADMDKKTNKETKGRRQKSSPSTSSSGRKQRENDVRLSKPSTRSSTERYGSNASAGKKSLSSSESAKSGQKSKVVVKPQMKTSTGDGKKESMSFVGAQPKKQNMNRAAVKPSSHNVNPPTGRPQKKNTPNFVHPNETLPTKKKTRNKPKSMTENTLASPHRSLELMESVSMPCLDPSPSEIHQYVESWLEEASPDPVPYMEDTMTNEPKPQQKVLFHLGADSDSDETHEMQFLHPEDNGPSPSDTLRKSASCLSVSRGGPTTALLHLEQKARGLCVSMPSVRVDPVQQDHRLVSHKSAEVIESPPSTSNVLRPREKMQPILQRLCSSIQSIRMVPDTNTASNIDKSKSLPDFSKQVASVFGSPCKAFLSFLSVMTLRDSLSGSDAADSAGTGNASEAMLIVESLQKISAIKDQEEQRASLTCLRSSTSSLFQKHWKDFQILRERLESEPLSPRLSETEFVLDVVSDCGDAFEDPHIDELMAELNMPQDLRDEISSTIQQLKSVYPVEESTFAETERNHTDSEDDVEGSAEDTNMKQSADLDDTQNLMEIRRDSMGSSHAGDGQESQTQSKDKEVDEETEAIKDEEEMDENREKEEDAKAEELGGNDEENREAEEESGEESAEKEEESSEEEETVDEEEGRAEGDEENQTATEDKSNADDTDERDGVTETDDEEEECVMGNSEEGSSGERREEADEDELETEDEEDVEEGGVEGVGDVQSGEENITGEAEEQEEEDDMEDIVEVGSGENNESEEGEEEEEDGEEEYKAEPDRERTEDEEESAEAEGVAERLSVGETLMKNEDDSSSETLLPSADRPADGAGVGESRRSCEGEEAEQSTESPAKYSSEGACGDDKEDTDGRGEGSSSLPHPVEISQELLDFVNSALQSSSLICTYDDRGNIRIEPDTARVTLTKQTGFPRADKDSLYGLKCLPTPSTSELSDYRPETSESGGYKTQDSVDIVSESGEEASDKPSPLDQRSVRRPVKANEETTQATLSMSGSSRLKSDESCSSHESGIKASGEDLSYFSAASSPKADTDPTADATRCVSSEHDSNEGVLIDQGRWLLKENHLIRKSPPVSQGMYGNLDGTSIDMGQDNTSDDSPTLLLPQHSPLAAISSSELEEMAKPQTPKCTYYNMPHGSDSDPFLDDASVSSRNRDASSRKGRSFRVSPAIDTSKTWANKNGSLSSFASVEFKLPDRKVHPEGESSAATQARRTSSEGGRVLQAQDSLETMHMRCGQYCPIL